MRVKNESAITLVILATGISSVITQLLTIREFLALFAGNEFVIAVIMFSWLVSGGAGTSLAYRVSDRLFKPSIRRLAWLSLIIAVMSPVHLLAIRLLRDVFFVYGSETGFYPFFFYTLITVTPYSLLIGFALPYSLFVLRQKASGYPGAMVYIIDNIGDITGGAIFSFLLLFIATPLQSICFSSLLLLIATCLLLTSRNLLSFGAITGIVIAATAVIAPVIFETKTLESSGGDLIAYSESRYGRIQVEHQADQYTLFLDGVPVANSHSQQGAENAAHYPLSQVDNPDHVLVISAMSGIMKEILKHRPQSIDYVEIDPEITRAMLGFNLIEKSNRINIIHDDARAFLARTKKQYDAIIMCLPEPETYQLNRFYTLSFFSLIKQHLNGNGIFSFSLRGFDNYPSEPDRQKLSTVHNTAAACFQHVLLLPGEDVFFLSGATPIAVDIPRRLQQKKIDTTFIADYFDGNVTPDRIDHINSLIDPAARTNSDIRPRLMRLMFASWFSLFDSSPAFFYGAVGLFLMIYWLRISAGEFVLFSTGFASMGSEILTIFAFQIFFGYIYFEIGLIITVFLAGLLPGAWIGQNIRYRSRRIIMLLDAALILLSGLFAIAVTTVGAGLPMLFFLIFGFLFSCICGTQFPAILRLFGDKNKQTTGAFTADLIGAATGALLTSTILIPHAGLTGTALAIIGLKTISIIITGAGRGTTH